MDELIRYIGLLTPVVVTGVGLYIVRTWPAARDRSFSVHIAKNTTSFWLFAAVLIPMTVLYFWYLATYIGPRYESPAGYYWFLAAAFVLQILFLLTPAKGKRLAHIHSIAALGVGVAMVAVTFILVHRLNGLGLVTPVVAGTAFLVYSVGATIGLWLQPLMRRHTLVLEAIFILLFWVFIATAGLA